MKLEIEIPIGRGSQQRKKNKGNAKVGHTVTMLSQVVRNLADGRR